MSRRWSLRSIPVLKHCMANPGRGGPFSVRSLAEAAGVGQGVIEKLLTGRQRSADVDDAIAIAEAVGVAINVLFASPPSPNLKRMTRDLNRSSKE